MKRRERRKTALRSWEAPGLAAMRDRLAAALAGLLLGGAVLCTAPGAMASCLWEPPQHLFVLPADGAADVPVDAHIWVSVAGESHAAVTVGDITLEGQRESLSWYSFPPPDPAPGAACEFAVRICASEGGDGCTDFGPYSFTFGTGTAPVPAAPTLLAILGIPSEDNFAKPKLPAELCKYQILSQDCFDMGQNLIYRFVLADDPGTALFAVLGTKADKVWDDYLSTPDCGAQYMALAPWSEVGCSWRATETCSEIQAINLAGTRSEPVQLCDDAQITLDDGSTWHSDCVTQEDASGSAADKDAAAPATPGGGGGGGAGCSATTQAPASGAFALLAGLALAFALLLRRRRSAAVVLLALGLVACDTGSNAPDGTDARSHDTVPGDISADETVPIDPADLEPEALVFAAKRGGGMLMEGEEIFFTQHHGTSAVYILGDRTVYWLGTDPEQGYRVFYGTTVPETTFAELLGHAAELTATDKGHYTTCEALDAGSEFAYVNVPGVEFETSAWTAFAGEAGCEPPAGEPQPSPALAALVEGVFALRKLPGEPVVTDRILLGGYQAAEWGAPCAAENATEWPFDSVAFPKNEEYTFWTQVLEEESAAEVRDFLRAHLDDKARAWGTSMKSACVSRDGQFYRAFYDDMLAGEEEFPF